METVTTAAPAAKRSRKRAAPQAPQFQLTLVAKDKVLAPRNVRWFDGAMGLLQPASFGNPHSLRNVYGYVLTGEKLFALPSEMFSECDGNFRVFLGAAPAVVDMTEAFAGYDTSADTITVSTEQQQAILVKIEGARRKVVNLWVAALSKPSSEQRLTDLRESMAPYAIDIAFSSQAFVDLICDSLRVDRWSGGSRISLLMRGESFHTPHWAGAGKVQFQLYMWDRMTGRYWRPIKNGVYIGVRVGLIAMDRGPIAVVKSSPGMVDAARKHCEDLIASKAYGDVVLLMGEGAELHREAQRVSDFLYGVDILEL